MPEFVIKYADPRGEIRQQVIEAPSEQDLRERYAQQGYLIYSLRSRRDVAALSASIGRGGKKINLEKFLIFNQQFLTLIRAGLP
ncbi:MAG: type II secretion system F family protein, partial [Bryobacteraceae bacterium]|nr:type II secretion system F family protein [Bryobacteraceae bacterium]